MAHHKSAWKRHLQSQKRRAKNRSARATFRSQVKTARAEIAAGTASPTEGAVHNAQKLLAKAGRKNLLHPKAAARRISRLMKAANKSKQG